MTRRAFLAAIGAVPAAAKAARARAADFDPGGNLRLHHVMVPDVKTMRACAWLFPDPRTGPNVAIYWDDGYEPDLIGFYDSPGMAEWIRSQSEEDRES